MKRINVVTNINTIRSLALPLPLALTQTPIIALYYVKCPVYITLCVRNALTIKKLEPTNNKGCQKVSPHGTGFGTFRGKS